MGKKMLSFDQNDQGVTIRCSDESTYHGDILVGADGAHSAVREHLFKLLKGNNKLPRSDDGDLPSDCVCLVGQTEVLDPKNFPEMKLSRSKFDCVLDDEYVVSTPSQSISCNTKFEKLTCNSFSCNLGSVGDSYYFSQFDLLDRCPTSEQRDLQVDRFLPQF